jgi:hypothetical protein
MINPARGLESVAGWRCYSLMRRPHVRHNNGDKDYQAGIQAHKAFHGGG